MKKIVYFLTFMLGLSAYSQNNSTDTLTLGSLSSVQNTEQAASSRIGLFSTENGAQASKTETSRSLPYSVHVANRQVVKILGFLDLEIPKPDTASMMTFSSKSMSGAAENMADNIELRVSSGSALILGNAADSICSEFHIRANTTLIIEAGATLFIDEGSQIIVENGGALVIRSGAVIESVSPQSIQLNIGAQPCLDSLGDYDDIILFSSGITFPPIIPIDPNPSWVEDSDLTYINQLSGVVSVNDYGKLNYQIPLNVPVGTAGMQPNISIVFSSQGADGILGKGFALSGFSSIYRTGKTIFMDNEQSAINLSDSDAYALDGERLIYTGSGSARGGVNKYDTKNAGFAEIISYGNTSLGAQSFKIYAKDGSLSEYGTSYYSRQTLSNGAILRYHIEKQQDANGNYIHYVYNSLSGETVISEINYTGNTGLTPYNKISFNYISHPFSKYFYVNGQAFGTNRLLSEIVCKSENNTVKTYRFYYDMDEALLMAVREFNASDEMIGELRFEWDNGRKIFEANTKWTSMYSSQHGWQVANHPRMLADMNGDGFMDIVGFAGSNVESAYGSANGFHSHRAVLTNNFGHLTGWNVDEHPRYLKDVNGDGMADIVGFGPDGVYVSLSNGSSFPQPSQWTNAFAGQNGWSNVKGHPRFLEDFNGDGLPDIIAFSKFGVCVAINSGSNFQGGWIEASVFGGNQGWNYSDKDMVQICDLNGDGKADILGLKFNRTGVGKEIYTMSALMSQGNSWSQPIDYGELEVSGRVLFEDVNNDGMTDIVCIGQKIHTHISRGNGFNWVHSFGTYPNINSAASVFLVDVNGDGYADIVGFTTNGIYVALNNGTSFADESLWNANPLWKTGNSIWTNTNNFYRMADVNGDGACDVVGFTTDGVYVSLSLSDSKANLIKVQDNLGDQFTAEYDYLTNSSVYTKAGSQTFPLLSFQGAYAVCKTLTDRASQKSYLYEGAKIHMQGAGFLGFEKLTEINQTINTKIIKQNELNTTYWLNLPKRSQTYLYSTNQLVRQSDLSFEISNLGSKRILSKPKSQTEYDALTGITTSTVFTYDSYGNVLTCTTTNGGTSIQTITNTYVASASRSIPNRIQKTESKHYYTGSSKSYPQRTYFTYDSKGNVIQKIDNYQMSLPCTTTYVCNTYGLPTQSSLSASAITTRTETYGYDSKYRFQTSLANAVGTRYGSYDALGKILSTTDYGGQITTYTYDKYGRVKTIKTPDNVTTTYTTERIKGQFEIVYSLSAQRPGSPYQKQYMDNLGRVLKTESPNPSGLVYTENIYNAKGQLTSTSMPRFAIEEAKWKTFTYDAYGRLKTESYQGQTTTYNYNGLTESVVSPSGQSSSKTYNAAGDLISATDAGGTISYTYEVPGYLKTVTAPGNAVTTISYNSQGHQTSVTDPSAGTIQFNTNAFGEIVLQKDARNGVTQHIYDQAGRLASKRQYGVNEDITTTYTYSTSGTSKGLVTNVSSTNGASQTYTYDACGRLIQLNDVYGSSNLVTKLTYNSDGNQLTHEYPSGFKIYYVYDNNGHQKEVRENNAAGTLIWRLNTTNALGQEISSTYIGNRTKTNTYNAFGQPTQMALTGLMNYTYSYQASTGNMTGRNNVQLGFNETFTYDGLDRLTTGVAYQPNGNISSKAGAGSYTYHDSKKHALLSASQVYADNQEITYNTSGTIKTIYQNNPSYYQMSFVYNPNGQRRFVSGSVSGNDNFRKHYSVNYEYTDLANGDGGFVYDIRKEYIHSPYGLVAIRNNGTISAVATDHLGSIVAEYHPRKGAYSFYGYDAWGKRYQKIAGAKYYMEDELVNLSNFYEHFTRGYTGHEHMDMFGLINMNGRLYDPLLGRMLSPDPYVPDYGYTQDFNRYTYVRNNPLKYIDPSGWWVQVSGGWTTDDSGDIEEFFDWLSTNSTASMKEITSHIENYQNWLNSIGGSYTGQGGGGYGGATNISGVNIIINRDGSFTVNQGDLYRAWLEVAWTRAAIFSQLDNSPFSNGFTGSGGGGTGRGQPGGQIIGIGEQFEDIAQNVKKVNEPLSFILNFNKKFNKREIALLKKTRIVSTGIGYVNVFVDGALTFNAIRNGEPWGWHAYETMLNGVGMMGVPGAVAATTIDAAVSGGKYFANMINWINSIDPRPIILGGYIR